MHCFYRPLWRLGIVLLLCSCTLTKVSQQEALDSAGLGGLPEDALLDIGITVLDPLLEEIDPDIGAVIDGLRFAESRYLGWQLANTLRTSGHWGRISLQPAGLQRADLMISGRILQSDGQTLRLNIQVRDATQRLWFDRQYVQIVNSGDFEASPAGYSFAFTPMFNRIANDMLRWRERRLDAGRLVRLRNVTEMLFASDLAPEAYGAYLQENRNGLVLARLPASDDPIYARIADMRQRNDIFVDTLNERYALFVSGIEQPYLQFLDRSLRITEMINEWLFQQDYDNRYQAFVDEDFTQPFETRFTSSRSPFIRSRSNSLNSGWRTEYYAMALAEAGLSLDELVRPESEIFDERIISLTNGAGVQYAQWKLILDELYELESVAAASLVPATQ